jgi:hypothetical protein
MSWEECAVDFQSQQPKAGIHQLSASKLGKPRWASTAAHWDLFAKIIRLLNKNAKIPSDGIPITVRWRSNQSQTKVSGDCQRETTHEICCLAAEWPEIRKMITSKVFTLYSKQKKVWITLQLAGL